MFIEVFQAGLDEDDPAVSDVAEEYDDDDGGGGVGGRAGGVHAPGKGGGGPGGTASFPRTQTAGVAFYNWAVGPSLGSAPAQSLLAGEEEDNDFIASDDENDDIGDVRAA